MQRAYDGGTQAALGGYAMRIYQCVECQRYVPIDWYNGKLCYHCSDKVNRARLVKAEAEVERLLKEVERQKRFRRKATQKTRRKHNELKRLRGQLAKNSPNTPVF